MTSKEIVDYVMHTPLNTNPSILNEKLQEYLREINSFYKESNLTKIEDYLYSIDYDFVDYKAGELYAKVFKPQMGGCSSVSYNGFYGRNYDWKYDDAVSFIVHVTPSQGRHESYGVAVVNEHLTKEVVETLTCNDFYAVLPNMTLDGINDAGVICNTNVCPTGAYGRTEGAGKGEDLCILAAVRYVLDYADSADDAITKLAARRIWAPQSQSFDQELHLMIGDKDKTYIVEFINNKMVVLEQNIMTNFYLYGVNFNSDGSVYTPGTQDETHNAIITNNVTKFGSGLERYNLINDSLELIEDKDDMIDLMKSLYYTKAYESVPNGDSWCTEFVEINGLTVANAKEDFAPIFEAAYEAYVNRIRGDGKTWQTVHTSVYDIEDKEMTVLSQEGLTEYTFSFE